MKRIIKYVGLVSILSLFTVALITDYFIDAEAKKAEENHNIISPILPQPTMQLVSGEEPKIDPIIKIIGIGR